LNPASFLLLGLRVANSDVFGLRLVTEQVGHQLGVIAEQVQAGSDRGQASEVSGAPVKGAEQLVEQLVITGADPNGEGGFRKGGFAHGPSVFLQVLPQ
jgi:hypothetical protein